MDDIVIQATGLCKCYQAGATVTPVLRDISLSVPRGECLFLVGPSGSGKTTLLSILGCVLSADAGRLELLGEDVTEYSHNEQARFRREKIGFVFQRFHLFEALTAAENVRVPLNLLHRPAAEAYDRAIELLALVGLHEKADSPVTRLSMGQRQRVAFARALAGDPDLVLADEPTASLDAEAGHNAICVLKNLCHALDKTVVVVTHDSRIFDAADRILLLSDGQITTGDPFHPADPGHTLSPYAPERFCAAS